MDPQEKIVIGGGDALIVTDIQNDFLPGGSLAVPGGDEVVPVLNHYVELFSRRSLPIFATRDWHPAGHISFRGRGGPWPPHCVAGTPGAQFASDLRLPPGTAIISKATEPDREAYSSFAGTDLDARLSALGVRRIFIGGLATDYCVLRSVEDARARGYEAFVLLDAIRAVDAQPGDGQRALERMLRLGAKLLVSGEIAA